jgi:hypothetical protein
MNEHGGPDSKVMSRWEECYFAAKDLPSFVCVRLARRTRARMNWTAGGSTESVAASEIYAIAFEGVPILRSVEEHLQPVLDRLRALQVAERMMGDE